MKFTLSWLKSHLQTDALLHEITDKLTQIGLELEGIADPGSSLQAFRVAHVVDARQHPNADRLRVCDVDTGRGGLATVVCGAPNAHTGMKAVFAPPGAYIPGTNITLKTGEIRGVQSAGMLLSAREMGLGDDHSGIIELPHDAPVGMSYPAYAGLDDPVIEIGVTPNRGDCFSVRGVARDLAAAGLGILTPFAPPVVTPMFNGGPRWKIAFPEACSWIIGRTIRGVRNSPSPKWLQDRLTFIGLRPINALVDITNFFTFDLGRPLHAFDVAKLSGDTLTLRRGANETMRALNGRDYVLDPEDCAICDAAGVQSIAGVIGGEATGCDETTTSVFLECALFDPIRIALTGRRHQITSDARQRFERGVDPALMPDAVQAAAAMILELCGGEPGDVTTAGAEPNWQRDATMRFDRIASFGGSDIQADEAVGSLQRLGFTVRRREGNLVTVAVPSWRNDVAAPITLDQSPTLDPAKAAKAMEGCIAIEAENDLIEEVLRLRGLDAVVPVSLPRESPVPQVTLTARQQRTAIARRTLAAAGLMECVTFSFMAQSDAERFGDAPDALRLSNPIASDLDQLRPTPLATLALAARRNASRGYPDTALFEIGPAFAIDAPDGQKLVASGLRAGQTPRNWLTPQRPVDVMDAKADLWALLTSVGVPLEALQVTPDAPPFLHPGRSGTVRQGPKAVMGYFGEIHPRLLTAQDLPGPMVGFELNLDAVGDPKRRKKSAPDLSAFQPVRRDFAFIVDSAVAADSVLRAAKGAERALIAGVILFDLYEGDRMADGKKSLGVEVTLQPRERTLTDAEIEAASQKVVAAVAKATGATLR
jgi:phenylalanyl-tRNA synthetase beta chain